MSEPRRRIALRCVGVEKSYPVQNELRMWRIFSGVEARGQMISALRGITMEVPRGKIVGILGKNGAGKSTLLRVLGGVYQPTRGRVEAYGVIAGLFELGGMGNPNLTGREYSIRYLEVMGAQRSDIPALLEDIREFSELEDAFDHRVRTYSSGMGARLYFAAATVLQNEIYLIDELLSVGDEHFQAKCWQRMRQRLLNGASGVLVTHDWAAILKLCEQAHVIEGGEFIFSGRSDQAVVQYLKIPQPEASKARFSPRNPQTQIVRSGEDATIRLYIEILETLPVDLSISVEMLRIGVGWEVVVLGDRISVGEHPGEYEVDISFPNLPLTPGNFSLNGFLSKRKLTPQDSSIILDTRSWTIGNGYDLRVEGAPATASVKLPFAARKILGA